MRGEIGILAEICSSNSSSGEIFVVSNKMALVMVGNELRIIVN